MGDTPMAILESKPRKNLNSIVSLNIRDHFPFDEIRTPQEMGLKAVELAIKRNKKFIVMELPTGAGKSGIGIAAGSLAKLLPLGGKSQAGAYYLSPQKSLTAQLARDFGSMGLAELKGRSNYTCHFKYDDGNDMDCETAAFMYEEHEEPGGCSGYKPAKSEFCNVPLGVTNFAYYLSETSFAGQLKNRTMLILDEAHGCEQHILGLASIELTRYRCEEAGIDFNSVPYIKADAGGMGKAVDWLNEVFRPAATNAMQQMKLDAEDLRANQQHEAAKLMKKASGMERFLQQLGLFLNSTDRKDWMVWSESDVTKCPACWAKLRPGTERCWKCKRNIPLIPAKMIIKPLTATLFADSVLFSKADKVIMMSATILDFDTFLRNLGIKREDAICVAVPSDFPVENRPIYYRPVGNMSAKTIDATLPKLAKEIEKLLNENKDVKGIIHTHTYKITKYVVEYLQSRGFGSRILSHTDITGDRYRVVREHIERVGEPTVIISPSMTEGLDLKDDLSRFSIVCKVPYPFLSNYVKARMERDPDWYAWCTALTLQQATGRSNRHKGDKAKHYILDEAFGYFVTKNEKIFSKWWLDSLVFPGDQVGG